jgi:H+/Cl- antiporter ClcA
MSTPSIQPDAEIPVIAPGPLKVFGIVVATGVAAGLGGMLLGLLLHAIQHLAFGYSDHHTNAHVTFMDVVSAASPERRLIVLLLCGLVAGIGWWLVYRFGRALVSVRQAVTSGASMPAGTTFAHILLQIVTIGLGSPLGREVAPRELGALIAQRLSAIGKLPVDVTRLVVACGSGAGLAAVYNAPLGATVFILEVLLQTFQARIVVMALGTCGIATAVAWIGLGQVTQYHLPALTLTSAVYIWAVLAGPLFGAAGCYFSKVAGVARQQAARGWQMMPLAMINFMVIGALAMYLPELLGNGKSVAQQGFNNQLVIASAALLLVLKIVIEITSLRAGAEGGLLTPGLSNGALLAVVLGGLWSMWLPGTSVGAYALIGAAAFLASSMAMPLTAIVLMMELTRFEYHLLVPVILAVAGASMTQRYLQSRR